MSPEQRRLANRVRLRAQVNASLTEKPCSNCGQVKPLDDFHRSTDGSLGGRRATCKACVKAWHADRYRANAERYAENSRQWYLANAERHYEAGLAWARANPGSIAARNARRRSWVNSTIELVDIERIWRDQCGICAICSSRIDDSLQWPHRKSKSIDHIIPLAKGGSHVRENLQWTHLVCNLSKGARLLN